MLNNLYTFIHQACSILVKYQIYAFTCAAIVTIIILSYTALLRYKLRTLVNIRRIIDVLLYLICILCPCLFVCIKYSTNVLNACVVFWAIYTGTFATCYLFVVYLILPILNIVRARIRYGNQKHIMKVNERINPNNDVKNFVLAFTRYWLTLNETQLPRAEYLKQTKDEYIKQLTQRLCDFSEHPADLARYFYDYFIKLWKTN